MLAGSEHRRHGIDYGRVHEIITQMGPLLDFNIPWQRSTVSGLHQQLLPEKAGFIPLFHRQMKTGNASKQWESRKEGWQESRKKNDKINKRKIWYVRLGDMFFIPKDLSNASHCIPATDKKKHCKLGTELFLNSELWFKSGSGFIAWHVCTWLTR